MSTNTETSLRVSRVIKAPREAVFRAWTEPDQLTQWSSPVGVVVESAEVDLTVGGRYHIRMKSPENEHNAVGVYQEIDPPRRLVYTWNWAEQDAQMGAHMEEDTLVTVEFNDVGGSTEVVLTHERFPNVEHRNGHEQGWASCLDRLEAFFG